MEETKRDETRRVYSLIGVLGITMLAFLMLVSIAGAAPFAYITNAGSNTVSVIDTAINTVAATVPVGNYPWGVAVNSAGTKVYVTNEYSNTVSVIDTATNNVTATVPVGAYPWGIAVSPDGTKVYVTNSHSNTVSVIDTITNDVIATVPVGDSPYGVAVNSAGTEVYVANRNSNTISVIDTATNNVTATVNAGDYPWGIVVNPEGTKVYVTNSYYSNTVSVIDTATNNVVAQVPVGSNPLGVAVNPEGTEVYVANCWKSNADHWGNTVSVIDTATNTVTATVNVGINPHGVAVNPEGTKVYVANPYDSTVSIIDTTTKNVTAAVNVETAPVAIGQFIGPLSVQPVLPVANFSANPTSGIAPLNVSFTDTSTGTPTAWEWNFGDRTNSTEQNPVHKYSRAGNYTVNLTVSNANGKSSKSTRIIVMKPVFLVANFTSNVTQGYVPLSVQFNDTSTGTPTSWIWNFGDRINSTEENPTHKYSRAGNYTVALTVTNAAGNNTITKKSYIKVTAATPKPVANFTSNITNGSAPLTVQFTDLSKYATSWSWNFGDRTNSTVQNPTHKYSRKGNYTVALTAINAVGNNTMTKKSYIKVR